MLYQLPNGQLVSNADGSISDFCCCGYCANQSFAYQVGLSGGNGCFGDLDGTHIVNYQSNGEWSDYTGQITLVCMGEGFWQLSVSPLSCDPPGTVIYEPPPGSNPGDDPPWTPVDCVGDDCPANITVVTVVWRPPVDARCIWVWHGTFNCNTDMGSVGDFSFVGCDDPANYTLDEWIVTGGDGGDPPTCFYEYFKSGAAPCSAERGEDCFELPAPSPPTESGCCVVYEYDTCSFDDQSQMTVWRFSGYEKGTGTNPVGDLLFGQPVNNAVWYGGVAYQRVASEKGSPDAVMGAIGDFATTQYTDYTIADDDGNQLYGHGGEAVAFGLYYLETPNPDPSTYQVVYSSVPVAGIIRMWQNGSFGWWRVRINGVVQPLVNVQFRRMALGYRVAAGDLVEFRDRNLAFSLIYPDNYP